MKSLTRLLLILMFLGMFPLSCDRCNSAACECDDFSHVQDFRILDMALDKVNPETSLEVEDDKSYSSDSVALSLTVARREDVPRTKAYSVALFSSSLWACSPAPPNAVNPISELSITASNTFTYPGAYDTLSAGDRIDSLFVYSGIYNSSWSYEWQNFTQQENLKMKLASSPSQPTEIILNLQVVLEDGQIFKFAAQKLLVK